MLQDKGIKVSESILLQFLHIIIEYNPWFLDLDLWKQVDRNLRRNQAQGKRVPLSSFTMWALVRAVYCPIHIEDPTRAECQEYLQPTPPPPKAEPGKPPSLSLWCEEAHQLEKMGLTVHLQKAP
uniref:Beta-retroviral matrix protein domain-containing protein n=1 Tax=Myotis myotis TaxID=51298 RepID=A0A7J7S248_MYOMY|nr:hypothetical protein mMyoMyo1_010116 [Myotis myotis]